MEGAGREGRHQPVFPVDRPQHESRRQGLVGRGRKDGFQRHPQAVRACAAGPGPDDSRAV